LNKRAAAEESESLLSSDDDSDSITSVQPRKKSRGTTVGRMSGGTRSVRVSRGAKVAKGRSQVPVQVLRRGRRHRIKGVMTSPPRVMIDTKSNEGDALHQGFVGEDRREGQDDQVIGFKAINCKFTSRMKKEKVREELKWTGEETTFTETVNHFCWIFLFPKFKFLKYGWTEIMPDKKNSFYSLCMCHLKIPEGADKKDIWDRVIVPSVMRKYQTMKCNLNNDIKLLYMSTAICLCESTFAALVNYTDIYFIICLINTGEKTKVWPNE